MRMIQILEKKKNAIELSEEEIEFVVNGYTNGSIPDYQMSAFLMAVYFTGMTEKESGTLTLAMANSGDVLDLSTLGEQTVDKHSTGGVGDKTTLVVLPIAAALGCTVAKMSGRGLGFTGGTVDKLESIAGFRVELSKEEFFENAREVGVCLAGQSGESVPADKKMYALRDVTGTVDSIPLIASSIMSKKIASGAKNIVLDVKVGSGAFMKSEDDALSLAHQMMMIGKHANLNVRTVLTSMESPLGRTVGNALEVKEALLLLKNKESDGDFFTLCIELSAQMVSLTHKKPLDECRQLAREVLENGKAYDVFKKMVKQQGGDVSMIDDMEKLPSAKYVTEIRAEMDGYIASIHAEKVGVAASVLGAGRAEKGDEIDFGAGFVIRRKVGDRVQQDEVIASAYTNDETALANGVSLYEEAVSYSETPIEPKSIILNTISSI